MNKVNIAGNLIVDYVKTIDSYPQQGMLVTLEDISRCVGGCAANTAVDLALMDRSVSVRSIGKVGDDENGRYIMDTLTQKGVTCDIIVDSKRGTSFTDVMAVRGGERTFFHSRGANAAFGIDDIGFENLDCDLFHIGYILLLDSFDQPDAEYGTVMAKALIKVRSKGIKTSIDVVSENSGRFQRLVTPSLKYCDYLIINEVEASLVAGIAARDEQGGLLEENIIAILKQLLSLGVGELVAIHAPEAGWAMRRDGEFARAPAVNLPKQEIKGKVGAGDAFCAGMLYAVCRDFELAYSLRYAAAAAACNLTETNSIDGMRDYEGIVAMMDKWAD